MTAAELRAQKRHTWAALNALGYDQRLIASWSGASLNIVTNTISGRTTRGIK